MITLPETNGLSHPKMDGWNSEYYFPIGEGGLFSGAFAVSFREGMIPFCVSMSP